MPDESPPPPAAGATVNPSHARSKTLHDSKGWDGKLRVDRSGEASDGGDGPSESETENQDVEVPGQQIDADDGKPSVSLPLSRPNERCVQDIKSEDPCEQTCWMTIHWILPYVLRVCAW